MHKPPDGRTLDREAGTNGKETSMVSLALNADFDKLFEGTGRSRREDAGYLSYYRGKPQPRDPEMAVGWLEAKGVSDFVKCLNEEVNNG